MKRIVMKFGGTSVGDAAALRHTAGIIQRCKQEHDEVVVVISALAGMTDQIIRCMQLAQAGQAEQCGQEISLLQTRTIDTLVALFGQAIPEQVRTVIFHKLSELTALCGDIQTHRAIRPQAYAAGVSLGERISVLILAALLQEQHLASQAVEATRLIITDHHFYNASPIPELTHCSINKGLVPLLEAGCIPVVTGFIGATQTGEITTMGRGGSDYSAAILAQSLNADELWIWKDVDGILTTDPKMLPEAQLVKEISFNETYALAYYGAKVLHPKTLLTARDSGIPIRIMNTFNPDSQGTLISPHTTAQAAPYKAVTGIEQVYLVSVVTDGRIAREQLTKTVSTVLSAHAKEVLAAFETTTDRSLHFAVREEPTPKELHALKNALHQLVSGEPLPDVWVWNGQGIVSVIGQTETDDVDSVSKTLADAGVDTGSYQCQRSASSTQFLVPVHQVLKAIQSIHREVIVNAQCK